MVMLDRNRWREKQYTLLFRPSMIDIIILKMVELSILVALCLKNAKLLIHLFCWMHGGLAKRQQTIRRGIGEAR